MPSGWPPTQSEAGSLASGQRFELVSEYAPTGDQPQAIEALTKGVLEGRKHQVLLGITGSGKTFTVANLIAKVGRPTLVMAPNKTLAAQLFGEFKRLFPNNSVEYFVSYYDYYQPEAYVPSSDTFIEKDSQINEQIDRLRHAATKALLERNDVIIIASVSCIYGLGSAEAYEGMLLHLEVGQEVSRRAVLEKLVEIHYERNETDFRRGTFRARGDVIDIFPASEDSHAVRIEMFGDEVERLVVFDPLRGAPSASLEKLTVYPASHYVTPKEKLERAVKSIEMELAERLVDLERDNKLLESQRLEQRTKYDLEMIREIGRCKGIENYSRHLSGRNPGEPPPTLIEYFPKDWLVIMDESHIGVPQVGGMFKGDRSRKTTLVEHGFRLPSAMDNRPLQFEEFMGHIANAVYVSATPGDWELEQVGDRIVEQIIRPTGLLDPTVEVRPAGIQVDDALEMIRDRVERDQRVLITVLTKRMAQELADYYAEVGVRVRYLHSDIDTLERMDILNDLRMGEFDVLVGINLLREGLDLPEVGLVIVMDADKEGFLRNERSLIQTMGRAARNEEGHVIFYGDRVTGSMTRAMTVTNERRLRQQEHNAENGIVPTTVRREVEHPLAALVDKTKSTSTSVHGEQATGPVLTEVVDLKELPGQIARLQKQMRTAAVALEFEEAAVLRDRLRALQEQLLVHGRSVG